MTAIILVVHTTAVPDDSGKFVPLLLVSDGRRVLGHDSWDMDRFARHAARKQMGRSLSELDLSRHWYIHEEAVQA